MEKNNANFYVPLIKLQMIKEKNLLYGSESICNSDKVVKLVNQIVEGVDREYAIVISCDSLCKPLAIEVVAIGSATEVKIAGREVLKHCVLNSAAGVLFVHNHPSGNPTPSKEDYLITRKIKMAAELLDIQFLDHIIVGDECYYSMKEMGDI